MDDLHKSASFSVRANPRRSALSLEIRGTSPNMNVQRSSSRRSDQGAARGSRVCQCGELAGGAFPNVAGLD
jgi:hypothetical protein